MPRPKGCTCGTPKPCKIHPKDSPEGASDTGSSSPELRVIDGGASPEQGRADDGGAAAPGGAPQPKRKRDPRPKPRERTKPVAPDKSDDQALQKMLAELLTMPAIPAAMLLDCDYCRDHFITEGPKAARELVALSLTNPALRGALESLHTAWSRITIAGILAGYLAKPLVHHVVPEQVLEAAGPVLGVPPRPQKPKHSHAPDSQAEHFGAPTPDQRPGDSATGIDAA